MDSFIDLVICHHYGLGNKAMSRLEGKHGGVRSGLYGEALMHLISMILLLTLVASELSC